MAKENSHPSENRSDTEEVSTSVPPAMLNENKPTQAHHRSHAAHLETSRSEPHTKPAGDLRQGSYPTGRKQP